MVIEMFTGLQKKDSQSTTQRTQTTTGTATGDTTSGTDGHMPQGTNILTATTETTMEITIWTTISTKKRTKSFISSMDLTESTMGNILASIRSTRSIMKTMRMSTTTTGLGTTMTTTGSTMTTICFITALCQSTSRESTTLTLITMESAHTTDMATVSITMTSHGTTRDTCTRSTTGKALTSGKENSITSTHTTLTLMIHGLRRLRGVSSSLDLKPTKQHHTHRQQRSQLPSRSQRGNQSQHPLQLLLPSLQLQWQLKSQGQRQKLHPKNLLHQRLKRRKLKNRKRNPKWPKS